MSDSMGLVTDREFSFNAKDFSRVRSLIYQRAGISLHDGKQAMVYSRLSRRLRDTGYHSFEQYLQWLESASGAPAQQEWQEFVNCLTTNLTSFFREEHHFQVLTEWFNARGLSPQRLRQHFLKGKAANAGQIRIKPELASMVEFKPFNLMQEQWQLGEPFDIVFCRNVMIYFDAPTQRKVLERIHRVMRPKGKLFVGHSENFTESRDLFLLRGKTVYDKV